jgi:hypothetical protein
MSFASMIGAVKSLWKNTYGSALEQYIVSHAPQSTGDVERLTREFDLKTATRTFL